MSKPRKEFAQQRSRPTFPPIVPEYVYPWPRFKDWNFGHRTVEALKKAGLEPLCFGKRKFFRGKDLIAVLAGER